jgi:hypothetical protein
MVVGLACTHAPATGGENVGVDDPSETAEENVTLMVVFEAAVVAPEAGVVETTESGVTTVLTVVAVVLPPFFDPFEDFPMP